MPAPSWVYLNTWINEDFSATGPTQDWWHEDFYGASSRPTYWNNRGGAPYYPHLTGFPSFQEIPASSGNYALTQFIDKNLYPYFISDTLGEILPSGSKLSGNFDLNISFLCKNTISDPSLGGQIQVPLFTPEGVSICGFSWFRQGVIEPLTVLQWEQFKFGPHYIASNVNSGATTVNISGFPYDGTIKAGTPVYIDDLVYKYILASDAVISGGNSTFNITVGLLHGALTGTQISVHFGEIRENVNPNIAFASGRELRIRLVRTNLNRIDSYYSTDSGTTWKNYNHVACTEVNGQIIDPDPSSHSFILYSGDLVIKGRTNDFENGLEWSQPSDFISFNYFRFQSDSGFPNAISYADFIGDSPLRILLGGTVQFHSTSVGATSYEWKANDVVVGGNNKDPLIQFNQLGFYDIRLTINGNPELTKLREQYVEVYEDVDPCVRLSKIITNKSMKIDFKNFEVATKNYDIRLVANTNLTVKLLGYNLLANKE